MWKHAEVRFRDVDTVRLEVHVGGIPSPYQWQSGCTKLQRAV